MNQIRTAWHIPLAIAVALIAATARAGEVTVVGSTWRSQPPPELAEGYSGEEPPPLPNGFVPPGAGGLSTGVPLGADVSPIPSENSKLPPRLFELTDWPLIRNWYTRIDYFSSRERAGGVEMDNEHGTLFNLGYMRSSGAKRLRVEAFTGNMHYGSFDLTTPTLAVESTTNYFGARAEFEVLWDINLHGWPSVTCFAGLGSRFWIRDIKDGIYTTTGNYWTGHQENWLTVYPYVGVEKRWLLASGDECFASSRLGGTAFTYEYSSTLWAPSLYPTPGLTGQVVCGLRHELFYFAAYFEATGWGPSPMVRDSFTLTSQMYTTGLQLGLTY